MSAVHEIMMRKNAHRIRLIYRCILSGLIVALAVVLIFSCLDIYLSGPDPFTPEAVAQKFQSIRILVYVTLLFIFGGIVLDWLIPVKRKLSKHRQRNAAINPHTFTETSTNGFSSQLTWGIRCVILLLACILIVAGIWNGGATDVLKKAAAICTECIGLG